MKRVNSILLMFFLILSFSSLAMASGKNLGEIVDEYIKADSTISYSDFEKIQEKVIEEYDLYVIDITDDTQNYPSLGKDLPKDIRDMRENVAGSKLSLEEIESRYGDLFVDSEVFYRQDGTTGKAYILMFSDSDVTGSLSPFVWIVVLWVMIALAILVLKRKKKKSTSLEKTEEPSEPEKPEVIDESKAGEDVIKELKESNNKLKNKFDRNSNDDAK